MPVAKKWRVLTDIAITISDKAHFPKRNAPQRAAAISPRFHGLLIKACDRLPACHLGELVIVAN